MNEKIETITIEKGIPLTVQLENWEKTLSKEIQKFVEWTAFNAMEVVLAIFWKNGSFFREFSTISDYTEDQIKSVLWYNNETRTLEKNVTV